MHIVQLLFKYKHKLSLLLIVYFCLLICCDVLFNLSNVEEKVFLYISTAVGCLLVLTIYYLFFWIMMKLPFTSKKMIRKTLIGSLVIWCICSILYGILYFVSGFSRLAFGIPMLAMADLKLLEKLEREYKDEVE